MVSKRMGVAMINNKIRLLGVFALLAFSGYGIAAEFDSSEDVGLGMDQLEDMVSRTQEQFGARKQVLVGTLRAALVNALVSAYIAGAFTGDCSLSSLQDAFAKRDWGFLARVFVGSGLSLEELVVVFRALRELYQINHSQKEFERILRDLFSSVEVQEALRHQIGDLSADEVVEQ